MIKLTSTSMSKRTSNRYWCRRHGCIADVDVLITEATSAGCPGDLANGEREAFGHSSGSGDDDHLVCLESCTHTPYLVRHY